MVSTCPRMAMVAPLGSFLRHVFHDLVDVVRDAAQIALVGVGVNVVDRLHIVVVHDRGGSAALQRRQIAQQLRCCRSPRCRL